MKIKFIALVLIIITFVVLFHERVFSKHYPIKPLESYVQVMSLAQQCDKDTLILFDCDDTLIVGYDGLANYHPPFFFRIRAVLRYPQLFKRENLLHYASIMFDQAQRFVIEPAVIKLIDELKQQGCIVLALTSMETGSMGVIKDFPEWRYAMLKGFGIEFSQTFPDVRFTKLPEYCNTLPALYKGMLCCNQQIKGKVLAAFLEHFNLKPSKIIFFDDSKSHLNSVGATCEEKNIPCELYHYLGAKKVQGVWNMDRALLQLDNLVQHNKWVTDSEADGMLVAPLK